MPVKAMVERPMLARAMPVKAMPAKAMFARAMPAKACGTVCAARANTRHIDHECLM